MRTYVFASTAIAIGSAGIQAAPTKHETPVFVPTYMDYAGVGKLYANVHWGPSPAQQSLKMVMDLGSADAWVYGPHAEFTYGTDQAGFLPTCTENITTGFNTNVQSVNATKKPFVNEYGYAGNSKMVSVYYSVNSSMSFPASDHAPEIGNVEVAISNFTALGLNNCAPLEAAVDYDEGIIGLASGEGFDDGPFFRDDLFDQGRIPSRTMSLWMDKAAPGNSTLHGTVLLGAVAPHKFHGDLVFLNHSLQTPYSGYKVPAPVISVSSISDPHNFTYLTSKNSTQANAVGGTCLLDTGSNIDSLPVDGAAFSAAAGLNFENETPFFNGSCDQLPEGASVKYEFEAANGGKPLEIKIPFNLYARDILQYQPGVCFLTISFDPYGCLSSAAFLSGANVAIDDAHNQVAMAQGGVSHGATEGVAGLGHVKYIPEGGRLPAR